MDACAIPSLLERLTTAALNVPSANAVFAAPPRGRVPLVTALGAAALARPALSGLLPSYVPNGTVSGEVAVLAAREAAAGLALLGVLDKVL